MFNVYYVFLDRHSSGNQINVPDELIDVEAVKFPAKNNQPIRAESAIAKH